MIAVVAGILLLCSYLGSFFNALLPLFFLQFLQSLLSSLLLALAKSGDIVSAGSKYMTGAFGAQAARREAERQRGTHACNG
jgi:hypothetical protein